MCKQAGLAVFQRRFIYETRQQADLTRGCGEPALRKIHKYANNSCCCVPTPFLWAPFHAIETLIITV